MTSKNKNMYSVVEPATEARFTNPIITSVSKRSPRYWDAYKVFLYSKVLNSALLAGLDDQLQAQPWLHSIVSPGSDIIIQYIWDSRQIVNVFESSKVAKAIRTAPWDKCANDAYSAKNDNPKLLNENKFEEAFDAMTIAKNWVEPLISVLPYRNDGNLFEFDISLDVPGLEQDTYIGFYHYDESKKKSELDIELKLLKDVYPMASKMGGKWQISKSGPFNYDEIVDIILNGLTGSKA